MKTSQKKFQVLKRSALAILGVVIVSGCASRKPLLMNRDGLYKFTNESPNQYLLYYNEDGKWEKTNKKVIPSTDMVIFYED